MFYIITRKLLGAFYVDQKKMDLPPSMLSSAIEQWGRVGLPIDGGSHAVPLQIMVNKIFVALVSMVSPDVPDIVMAPYWTNADANNIYITTDYETGHSYSGQGQNVVAWILISE